MSGQVELELGQGDRRRFEVHAAPLICLAIWLALVAVYAGFVRPAYGGPGLCLFRNITGVPCPTCGCTRAALALSCGEFWEAIALNPLFVAAPFLGVAWLAGRALPPGRERAGSGWRLHSWLLIIALLLLNWIYLIAREFS